MQKPHTKTNRMLASINAYNEPRNVRDDVRMEEHCDEKELFLPQKKHVKQDPAYMKWFMNKLKKEYRTMALFMLFQAIPDDDSFVIKMLTVDAAEKFGEDPSRIEILLKDLIKKGKHAKDINYMRQKYDLGKHVLGRGASGEVVKGKDKVSGRPVAIKVYKSTPDGLSAYKAESAILTRLEHVNIIKFYESVATPDRCYVVLELCTGGQLFHRIARDRVSMRGAARIFQQMLAAVQHMHSKKIVHRDLKPENFLFRTPHPDSEIVLIDFGYSKIVKDTSFYRDCVGTPYYVCPEALHHVARTGKVLRAGDVWSLGVITYVMMAGNVPFPGKTNNEIFVKILEEDPVPLPDKVPRAFEELCFQMLNKDPGKRITLKDALMHRWTSEADDKELDVGKLLEWTNENDLKKAMNKAMAALMPAEEKERLRRHFDAVDRDGNGAIDIPELQVLLVKCGYEGSLAAKEAITIIEQFGKGKTEIYFDEFVDVWQRRQLATNDDHIRDIFNILDKRGEGKIYADDFKLVCGDEAAARRYIAEVGENGYMDLRMFIKAMKEVIPSREASLNVIEAEDLVTCSRMNSVVGVGPIKIETMSREVLRSPNKPNVASVLAKNSTVGVSAINNRPVVTRSRSLVRLVEEDNNSHLGIEIHRARSYSPGDRARRHGRR